MSSHRLFLATLISTATLGVMSAAPPPQPADGKLKIFILSGQSNMIGFGQVKGSPGTMETYLKSNPKDLIGKSMGDSMVGLLSGKPIAPAGK